MVDEHVSFGILRAYGGKSELKVATKRSPYENGQTVVLVNTAIKNTGIPFVSKRQNRSLFPAIETNEGEAEGPKAEGRLTLSYLRQLEQENYLALAVVILLSAAGFFGSLYQVGGSAYPDAVSNTMYPLTSLVGVAMAFMTAYRARYGPLKLQPARQLAWLLVGLGLMANCLGGLVLHLYGSHQSSYLPILFRYWIHVDVSPGFLWPVPDAHETEVSSRYRS
jgi:hypothetical protein